MLPRRVGIGIARHFLNDMVNLLGNERRNERKTFLADNIKGLFQNLRVQRFLLGGKPSRFQRLPDKTGNTVKRDGHFLLCHFPEVLFDDVPVIGRKFFFDL